MSSPYETSFVCILLVYFGSNLDRFRHVMLNGQVTWDGGGGDLFWDNRFNWDTDTEPTAADDVIIPANFTVQVRMAGELAESIDLGNNAKLEVISGDLLVDTNGFGDDGIEMTQGSQLTITSGTLTVQDVDNPGDGIFVSDIGAIITIGASGNLIIDEIDDPMNGIAVGIFSSLSINVASGGNMTISDVSGDGDAIFVVGTAFTLDNAGTISFGANLMDDALDVRDGVLTIINSSTGIIQNTAPINEVFF